MGTPPEPSTASAGQSLPCAGALPPVALRGLEYFNHGEYFEAHEALETAWREEKGPLRELYRGILQVGVGYLHIQRGNLTGALKMFRRCRQWLDVFPDECRGINLAALRRDYQAVERRLQEHGLIPPSQYEFYFKPIEYRNPENEQPASLRE